MDNFDLVYPILLDLEGRYFSNNKGDKGGETNHGITWPSYKNIMGKQGIKLTSKQAKEQVALLKEDQIRQLYYDNYWNNFKFNNINDPRKAFGAFDSVVQHGIGAHLIQDALIKSGYNIKSDGHIGDQTIAALNDVDTDTFMNNLYDVRAAYYNKLVANDASQRVNLNGWMNRIANLKRADLFNQQQQALPNLSSLEPVNITGTFNSNQIPVQNLGTIGTPFGDELMQDITQQYNYFNNSGSIPTY